MTTLQHGLHRADWVEIPVDGGDRAYHLCDVVVRQGVIRIVWFGVAVCRPVQGWDEALPHRAQHGLDRSRACCRTVVRRDDDGVLLGEHQDVLAEGPVQSITVL